LASLGFGVWVLHRSYGKGHAKRKIRFILLIFLYFMNLSERADIVRGQRMPLPGQHRGHSNRLPDNPAIGHLHAPWCATSLGGLVE